MKINNKPCSPFPQMTVQVNGTDLTVSDTGAGAVPVVFVHGAVTDLRMWDEHRALLGSSYRSIASTLRYHGRPVAQCAGMPYGVRTHANDLIALLDALAVGPVHLVAWSYSGQVAFDGALRRPDLFRSLFVYEPGVPSYVRDAHEIKHHAEDAVAAFTPIFGAVHEGDMEKALRLLIEASSQSPGYFERQPAQAKAIQIDNAHTLARLLLEQEAPPAIGADELGRLSMPVAVGYGAESRPLYSIVSRAAQQAIPGNAHFVIPGGNHMWPQDCPADFVSRLTQFIEG